MRFLVGFFLAVGFGIWSGDMFFDANPELVGRDPDFVSVAGAEAVTE